jgi:hypothetical protein
LTPGGQSACVRGVTTGEPGSSEDQQALLPAPPAPRAERFAGVRRIVEWFWRGAALTEKRSSIRELGARAALLAQRAHGSATLALNTAELAQSVDSAVETVGSAAPVEPLAEVSASELYRQSAYWSLCALAAPSAELAGTHYDDSIWDSLDEQLLTRAAPGERCEVLRAALRSGSFVYFAELSPSEHAAISGELRKLADSLLFKVDERNRALQLVLLERAWRISLLVLAALLVCVGVVWERKTRAARSDLAQGAAWRTSSKYEAEKLGCTSPEQECPESPAIFFHTKEEKDPWVEFDLGKAREISTVEVDNRPDCCLDRAVPLFVEVSENQRRWKTVARQEVEFKTTWRATFAPVKARWVRLRVHKVSYLHLARVRIFP